MTTTAADALFAKPVEKKADDAPPEIPRDRWQRPLIQPIGGGKTEPYIRVSSLAGAIDDKTALGDWKARMTGLGVSRSTDLQVAFASIQDIDSKDDKRTANELAEQAQERAQSSAKRITGTAFHSLAEAHHRGVTPAHVPEPLRELYDNYVALMAGVKVRAIEQFVVVDEVKAAGTTDLVASFPGQAKARVVDVKTGRVDYGQIKFAIQLACYARGVFYNPKTGERRPWPSIDLEVGYILHADPATGEITPYEIDLVAGWEAAKLARAVYETRKAKVMREAPWTATVAKPKGFPAVPPVEPDVHPLNNVAELRERREAKERAAAEAKQAREAAGEPTVTILERLGNASTLQELNAIHAETGHVWTDVHVRMATQRAKELRGNVSPG